VPRPAGGGHDDQDRRYTTRRARADGCRRAGDDRHAAGRRDKGYPSIPFDATLAKYKANAAWTTFEMTAGHDAMVDQPQELTDLLLQVA
jgi:hypothetical protein